MTGRWAVGAAVVTVATGLGAGAVGRWGGGRAAVPPDSTAPRPAPPPGPLGVLLAAEAGLDDAREVIGVSADGLYRAYPLTALAPPDRHVVNDSLGRVPVAVTYCPKTECTRVYAGLAGAPTLGVRVNGWMDIPGVRTLVLMAGGTRYRQDTGAVLHGAGRSLPTGSATFTRTTWGEWRAAHPDTDAAVLPDPPPQL